VSPVVSTDNALLEVEDLRVAFAVGGREVRAVDGVTYKVEAGRTLAIIGESGSGKTVGCRAIMGLLPTGTEISGSARLRGTERFDSVQALVTQMHEDVAQARTLT